MARRGTPITADEKRWRAEDDAYTLATANQIRSDPDRLNAAQEAAKRMAEEERDKANAMGKVAKGAQSRPNTTQVPRKPDVVGPAKRGGGGFNVFKKV